MSFSVWYEGKRILSWFLPGKVYKGEVHVSKTEPVLQVAIKTLKENATLKTQQDFRKEVELMSELRHPNIVCLLGVVMRQQPYAMLFEYMTQVILLRGNAETEGFRHAKRTKFLSRAIFTSIWWCIPLGRRTSIRVTFLNNPNFCT